MSKTVANGSKMVASPSDNNEVRIKAAVLIQTWYRQYTARLEARRRAAWVVYQSIEYDSESNQINLQKFFDDILKFGSKMSRGGASGSFAQRLQESVGAASREERDLLNQTKYDNIEVEKSYSGPRLSFPLSAPQVQKMIEHFSKGGKLHARYVLQLLHETRLVLKARPNIYRPSTSISKQMTVVGDLHGKLDDLLLVLYKNGLPDVTNPYVFNGDFVDRGDNSVEVALLLFALQLVWPTAVCINRGNHEDCVINRSYGFVKEILQKYRLDSCKIVQLFSDVFAWLPLATVIDEQILVAHGGISDKLDLRLIDSLDRHRYFSAVRPSFENGKIDKKEWDQLMELLWSDPKPQLGCKLNKSRGGGCYFGPDVTENFLRQNKLKMIVRSHETNPEGYEFCHGNCVLTIFSASNYYSEGSNRGAYVKFDNSGQPRVMQLCASKSKQLPLGRRLATFEDAALRGLRAKIAASRVQLVAAFSELDFGKTDCVTIAQWCSAMESELQLSLPWRRLRPRLVKLTPDKRVMYMSTFQRTAVQHQGGRSASAPDASMMESVYKSREKLETIFRIMDRDNSGHISLDEFKECCRVLGRVTKRNLSEDEIVDMAKALDLNKDGKIDFNEFLEAFRIVEFQSGA
ncbi:hypothetical protein BOX15_Mlig030419g2 [Macrostomum lignano]|uniref:Serine/threonine-protein phosphatase n=1 Tax=Macrostomum lignano TaxID=282301 RepID=A0A267GA02_9PLAT|nr:hypothetical protein BOX15_Mlig030419g2 [Macrostomum lignano]